MNPRAIGIGVAVGIGGSLLLGVLFSIFPFDGARHPMWAILLISYGAGAIVDLACGATAGWIAKVGGALHGLLAGIIANVISPILGFAMLKLRGDEAAAQIDALSYLMMIVPSMLGGIALAALGGGIAAIIARKQASVPAP